MHSCAPQGSDDRPGSEELLSEAMLLNIENSQSVRKIRIDCRGLDALRKGLCRQLNCSRTELETIYSPAQRSLSRTVGRHGFAATCVLEIHRCGNPRKIG